MQMQEMFMKRMLTSIGLILAFVIFGCGGGGDDTTPTTDSPNTNNNIDIFEMKKNERIKKILFVLLNKNSML